MVQEDCRNKVLWGQGCSGKIRVGRRCASPEDGDSVEAEVPAEGQCGEGWLSSYPTLCAACI